MKKYLYKLLFGALLALSTGVNAQMTFFTDVHNKQIKTVQVRVAGELMSNPYIVLQGDKQIEINFDTLDKGYSRYTYQIIHCNSNWTQSQLTSIEYLNGFQGAPIEDFANSIGTTTQYTNYRLLLPNDDVQFKVSGNYAIRIFNEEKPEEPVLTACFSIVEPLVKIAASISGNTEIDTYKEHQQVSFEIHNKNFPITYPQTDLKISVYQNHRRDNVVTGIQPMSIKNALISYTFNRDLIFPAGNEYRRFECLSNKYNGMHVENISFHNPYYNVGLETDFSRGNQTYQYDQDQNGRFLIRCSGTEDPDTEADYYIVHFRLESEPLLDGNVYLSGDLFNNVLDEKSKMGYNFDSNCYEKAVLLKQGSYNYQYLFVPNSTQKGETRLLEGNYSQTENEYHIYIYYCPMGARYDRLIGVTSIRNAQEVF